MYIYIYLTGKLWDRGQRELIVRMYNIRVRPRFVDLLSLQLGRFYFYIYLLPLFSPPLFSFFLSPHLVVTRRKKARRGKRRRGRRGDWIESIWKFDRRKTRKVHYQFLDRNRIAAHVEYKYIFLPISVSMGERNVYTNTRQFSRYPWNITPKAKNSTSRIGFDPQPARPPQPFSITRYSIVRVCAKGELLSGNSWSPNTLGGGAARLY